MTNIFVGNLDITVTEHQLREVFAAHAAVETITIVENRGCGPARGIACVEMTQVTEAQNAISALDGKMLNGRPITMNETRAKLHCDPTRDSGRRGRWRHQSTAARSFLGKPGNRSSLTRDDPTFSHAIVRHNIRTDRSAGVVAGVQGPAQRRIRIEGEMPGVPGSL